MDQNNASPREKTAQSADTSVKKTYSCTFCKKGFSNAQALGGHMNIHRRDRAKLVMQSLDDDSHDVIVVPNKNNHRPVDDDHLHQPSESSHQEEITSSPKRPCVTLSREEDGALEQSKLSNIDGEEKLGSSPGLLIEEKEIDEPNHGCSFPSELDLELRLGHERPQQQSTHWDSPGKSEMYTTQGNFFSPINKGCSISLNSLTAN